MSYDWQAMDLRSGASDSDADGNAIWPGMEDDGYLPAAQVSRIVEHIMGQEPTLEDYYPESTGPEDVDPAAGKSWKGQAH